MLHLRIFPSRAAARTLRKRGVAVFRPDVEVFAFEKIDVAPEDERVDYPTKETPLKRVGAPVTRMDMKSQEIRVNTHIGGKVHGLSSSIFWGLDAVVLTTQMMRS